MFARANKKEKCNTVRSNILTWVCERLPVCLWQISKMLRNFILAPILSCSVGGVGFTPRCDGVFKAFVIFSAVWLTFSAKLTLCSCHQGSGCEHLFRSLLFLELILLYLHLEVTALSLCWHMWRSGFCSSPATPVCDTTPSITGKPVANCNFGVKSHVLRSPQLTAHCPHSKQVLCYLH